MPLAEYLLKILTRSKDDQEKVINLINTCLKFNFDLFDSETLKGVLDQLITITSSAVDLDTLKSCLNLIDTFIVFGYVPPDSLTVIMTLLSSARMVDDNAVKELSLSVLSDILNSKVSYLAMISLCDTVKGENTRCIVGCIRFLEFALFHYDEKSTLGDSVTTFMDSSISYVLNSLIIAANQRNLVISIEVLKLVLKLLELPIIKKHHFSLSKRSILWKLLYALQNQDSTADYNHNMVELFNKLQNLNSNSVFVAETVSFLKANPSILRSYNIKFILKYYSENLLCVYSSPNWKTNCRYLIDTYYKVLPADVFRVIKDACMDSRCIREDISDYVDMLFECINEGNVESLVEVLLLLDLDKFKEVVERLLKVDVTLAKVDVLLTIRLCQRPDERADYLFQRLLPIVKQSVASADVFLIFARLFMAMRGNDDIHFIVVKNIDGLCDTLGRNIDYNDLKDAKWVYPENHLGYFPVGEIATSKPISRDTATIVGWCDLCIDILENFYDWEIYSFVLSHFCPQVANFSLFSPAANDSILTLTRLICRQIRSPRELDIPVGNVQVALIRNLSGITCYKSLLSKADEDQIISSVLFALQSWNKTGIPCLHFLYIATYEFPESIKKFLSPILTILQTRISSPLTSTLILDFLLGLSDMPNLISNFTTDEFKRIFAIAFKFIQYSNDNADKKLTSLNLDDSKIEKRPSTQSFEITKQMILYITALSYSIIPSWFLKMNLDQRKQLAPYITKELLVTGSLRDLAYVEFITRYTQAAVGSVIFIDKIDGPSWIVDDSIVSVKGKEVVIRRATSVDQFKVGIGDELATPSFVLNQLMCQKEPIRLSDDPAIRRAISVLDRIPLVNFFKIGVLYVGPDQTTEDEILSNQLGSKGYHEFLVQLGDLIRLKDCTKYVGGLDTKNDLDGNLTVHYQTEVTQMCFHVATMMPNEKEDPHFDNKKRHIGNDYVNIYWNESGHPFESFVSSQFSFINIVIEPLGGYCSVKSYRKEGIPGIFATTHFKLISNDNLAKMVRNLCGISAQFSDVWSDPGWEFSWERRIRQVRKVSKLGKQTQQAD
ncbi:DEKNAAC105336 [Brettanomyces naardenensis]|uniref:DEKNAAC105336 n=1 Tax=Brettanomyces naardenensis TaxID=13370 RepID=A0A448YTC4_BRENA|nr:DEKNAAC105336 [Brettanomyces naardenensis]